jgi:hypothetical protein
MPQDESSKEKVQKLAAELAAELAELSRLQSEALMGAAYVRMDAAEWKNTTSAVFALANSRS